MLGVRLLQGEDYALFLHRKGPAQMLVPVTFWLLTGRITETLIRFPFALSSILSAITLFFMGRRWFSWQAGLLAGLLWVINGYAIAFGRMVQYQALIFLLGPLAIYCLYLAWKFNRPRLQFLAAVLLATCLLAHFDALLLLPAAGYLGWKAITKIKTEAGAVSLSQLITPLLALVLFLALLAVFYVPYLLDPEFANTATYLSETRVRPGLLYNNLTLLRQLDKDYSSHFYLPILAIGIVSFATWQSLNFNPRWRWGLAGLGLLLITTIWLPDTWQIGQLNLAVLPWLLSLVMLWLRANPETKTVWLMFGAPFIGYVFLVDDPRTHLYIAYPGAVLLAGVGWVKLYAGAARWVQARFQWKLSPLPIIVGLLLTGAIAIYEGIILLPQESTLTQLRRHWDGSIWEIIYDDLPKAREYFGYPKREGWKTIGALRAEGKFPGDFRSANEDFIIPIWYNYGEARSCYDTPAHIFVRTTGLDSSSSNQGYVEVGQVERENETRLNIFAAAAALPESPTTYALEDYEQNFDQLATPEQFARQAEPSQSLETQFGPAIKFVGYDLPTAVVTPGDTLYLNLYWQALENPGHNYRAFVHLTDGTTLWAQQDDDPACRLPTSIWRAGQRGLGQFRLPINPDTPPGRYPLIIGLYQADSLERLPITAGAGQTGDDFLWLGDVEIIKSD
jgi:hypothetical protein